MNYELTHSLSILRTAIEKSGHIFKISVRRCLLCVARTLWLVIRAAE